MLRQAAGVSLGKATINAEPRPQSFMCFNPPGFVRTGKITFLFWTTSAVNLLGSCVQHGLFGTRCPGERLCNKSTHGSGIAGLEETVPSRDLTSSDIPL